MLFLGLSAGIFAALLLHSLAQDLVPKPHVVESSGYWDGLDGPWSTFYVGVGQPLQAFRCVPGLNSGITLLPVKCALTESSSSNLVETCQRRAAFRYEDSTSWAVAGSSGFPIPWFDPSNATGALWGVDTFWLGTDATQSPRLAQRYVLGVTDPMFFVPVFGLAAGAIGGGDNIQTTILSGLKDAGQIPSSSFGYTAGNSPGSLILGGYDEAHFDPKTTLSVPMASSKNSSMIVSVTGMSISGYATGTWLPALFVIDSTMPQIWMTSDACKIFEEAFQLSWDAELELYTINDTTHEALLQKNPTVTFAISASLQGEGAVNYTLPYSAFDLTLEPPLVNARTYYFPLKRSPNGINLLGRAFLQEIYIIVDFERSNFSISQAVASDTRDIVTIYNTSYTPSQIETSPAQPKTSNSKSVSAGAYAGIAVAVTLVLLFAVVFFLAWKKGWWIFRKKRAEQDRFDKAELHDDAKPRVEAMGKERAELPANERSLEVAGSHPRLEVDGIHDRHELHGETRAV